MSKLDSCLKKLSDAAGYTKKKAEDTIEVKQLESRIRTSAREIDHICAAIGREVYRAHKENNTPQDIDGMLAHIDSLNAGIRKMELQIRQITEVRRCPVCNRVCVPTALFCTACGAKLPITEKEQ